MNFALWSTLVGGLLVFMALTGSVLSRLPLSGSMVYIAVGLAVSPLWLSISDLEPLASSEFLEHLAEVVVLVSLFTSGLKLSAGIGDRRWLLPVRLASMSMLVTVVVITAVGALLLKLPLGAAVLLAGVLAPTDPVLASEVQVHEPMDRDRLRFALTGEGGLNDGTAFPVVMLGLGILGLHDLGSWGWKWLAVDVVWAATVGLLIGALFGTVIGQLVLYLRRTYKEAVGLDDFLALGLIGLSYGTAVLTHAYGFLAVFAAGVALRRTERRATEAVAGKSATAAPPLPPPDAGKSAQGDPEQDPMEAATNAQNAPAFMAHAVLSFNEQVERIGEVAVVIAIGATLWAVQWQQAVWWFVPLVLLFARPLATTVGLAGARVTRGQKRLIGWFGIRGIGSLYYLAYAINHGLPLELADRMTALTLSVVVTSIIVHGVSVTPLMMLYQRRRITKDGHDRRPQGRDA